MSRRDFSTTNRLAPALRCALASLVLVLAGCPRQIGDTCETNANCSALGDRFCDTSTLGGYCTLDGCDVRENERGELKDSCPGEAVCVRFFEARDYWCDPRSPGRCAPDERCICDCGASAADPRVCLPHYWHPAGDGGMAWSCAPTGQPGEVAEMMESAHCAPESSERRWCQRKCERNEDCRFEQGYECRATGGGGAEPVPRTYDADAGVVLGDGVQKKFCVPSGARGAQSM